MGYPKGVFWNGLNRVRMEGHVLSSQVISYNSTLTDFANRVREVPLCPRRALF